MTHPAARQLSVKDIPAAMELSTEAGWNQTAEDWRTLIDLAPLGCLAIEVDCDLAATTTLMCYGQSLAWIGMVLTRVRYRGRGFARTLMTQALKLADQMRIETVKLDATDQGRPLYEKLGFRCEQTVERWWREGKSPSSAASGTDDRVCQYPCRAVDLRAFGADRVDLLSALAVRNPAIFSGNSYLFSRPGRLNSYLGPCVADTSGSARSLVERTLLTESSHGWYWDLLCSNTEAVALARSLGFAPQRHLTRMVRGKDLQAREEMIYAIAGFELG